MNSEVITNTTVLDYALMLPEKDLKDLYTFPMTCFAIYRELPEMAKHYILKFLFITRPIPQSMTAGWLGIKDVQHHEQITLLLSKLSIWLDENEGNIRNWVINGIFSQNLQKAIFGRPIRDSVEKQALKSEEKAFLKKFSDIRWGQILKCITSSSKKEISVPFIIIEVLVTARLMNLNDDLKGKITPKGFQYLLLGRARQVWHFMTAYFALLKKKSIDVSPYVAFLFRAAYSTLTKDYLTEGLSDSLQEYIKHLTYFGILYRKQKNDNKIYPTPLAYEIMKTKETTSDEQFILVESTFRIYSYTDCEVKISSVAIFSEMLQRFPSMAVSVITRESVREAFKHGITAKQIVCFLSTYAHSEMRKNSSFVPAVVVDQIHLWEREIKRFQFTEASMFTQFSSQREYEIARDFALRQKLALYYNDQRKRLVVLNKDKEAVMEHVKANKEREAALYQMNHAVNINI